MAVRTERPMGAGARRFGLHGVRTGPPSLHRRSERPPPQRGFHVAGNAVAVPVRGRGLSCQSRRMRGGGADVRTCPTEPHMPQPPADYQGQKPRRRARTFSRRRRGRPPPPPPLVARRRQPTGVGTAPRTLAAARRGHQRMPRASWRSAGVAAYAASPRPQGGDMARPVADCHAILQSGRRTGRPPGLAPGAKRSLSGGGRGVRVRRS